MELILATHNPNKIKEIRPLLPACHSVLLLSDLRFNEEIPEPFETLSENAYHKADYIYNKFQKSVLSEDTGLFVKILNGAPGVYSARYAGTPLNMEKNIAKLWDNLKGKSDTEATFTTVFCCLLNGQPHYFEGDCKGHIIFQKRGKHLFGYDPVFIPDGSQKTFAEMSFEEKRIFSHREKALQKLVSFLQTI